MRKVAAAGLAARSAVAKGREASSRNGAPVAVVKRKVLPAEALEAVLPRDAVLRPGAVLLEAKTTKPACPRSLRASSRRPVFFDCEESEYPGDRRERGSRVT